MNFQIIVLLAVFVALFGLPFWINIYEARRSPKNRPISPGEETAPSSRHQ